jgi:xanthine dehydrogenase YagS FAD-binding subunit
MMKSFTLARAETLDAALDELQAPGTMAIAGGTELLNWLKEGIVGPDRLLDISRLPMTGIETGADGLVVGALARMSDVAAHPVVATGYPVLAQSLLLAASAQLRNMATIGGNLMQRTRCAYFRADTPLPCNQRVAGSGCAAREGDSSAHAIFGATPACVATHPSDLAVALAALDATAQLRSASGERTVALADFHRLPTDDPRGRHTALEPGELIVSVTVPGPAAERSHFLKVRERVSYEFAVVSAAAAVQVSDTTLDHARIALGGVAHRPWRLTAAEHALVGTDLGDTAGLRAAVATSFADAHALPGNAYKIELAQRVTVRALRVAGGMG